MAQMAATISYAQPPSEYTAFTDESFDFTPPPPPDNPFSIFGEPKLDADAIQTLAEENVPALYDDAAPPLFELKRINHRILFAFQKLVGIIAVGTESPDDCLEHIHSLFMNAHYLLNKLRSFQAYENMHHFLREQNRKVEEFRLDFDTRLFDITSLQPP
jgi:hypothetical protein